MSFLRRENFNGTWDTICRSCFVTVTTVRIEEQLAPYEHGHLCDPLRAFQIEQGGLPWRAQ